jgi:hypothetical protein
MRFPLETGNAHSILSVHFEAVALGAKDEATLIVHENAAQRIGFRSGGTAIAALAESQVSELDDLLRR